MLAPFISSECFYWDEFNPPSDFDSRPPPTPDDVLHGRRAIRMDLIQPTVLIAVVSYARPRKTLRAASARDTTSGRARPSDHRIVEQGLAAGGNRQAGQPDRVRRQKGSGTAKRGRPPSKTKTDSSRVGGRGRPAARG